MTKPASDIIAKAAAIRRSPQFLAKLETLRATRRKAKAAVRVPSEAEKATARRKVLKQVAKPAAKPATAPKAAPLERDNGDRLIAARNLWSATMTEAHRLSRTASRNLNGAELRLLEVARTLPRTAPNENSTLRDWRTFTASVEAARPAIEATGHRV